MRTQTNKEKEEEKGMWKDKLTNVYTAVLVVLIILELCNDKLFWSSDSYAS
jgi:hypothetical protein